MIRPLEDIIQDYENLRANFRNFSSNGESGNKNALLEYQERFLSLKADLRPWHVQTLREAETRSDKAATAIKMRIAVAMVRDTYKFAADEKPMYEKPPSITNAEKFAGGSKEYKEFFGKKV